MSYETMQRAGFSPYGPSKAALESETIIWAQDLAGTGVTVNALLPGGATLTGMIPPSVPERVRTTLLAPDIVVPPLMWLASPASDGVTGKRVIANRWPVDAGVDVNRAGALESAGWART
jgi:NAD(P)-dependent dehydrogenase (short-subunit alcohol dehydrogenase family)